VYWITFDGNLPKNAFVTKNKFSGFRDIENKL
jgi:hypothetical protein